MKQLERIARRRTRASCVVTPEMARALTEISLEIQRQVGVLLNRRGHVTAVVVGDARGLFLPDIRRRGRDRLVGLRLVHTHLANQKLDDDDLTDLALLRLDLVAAVQVGADGLPGPIHMAHLLPDNAAGEPWQLLPQVAVHDLADDFPAMVEALEEEFIRHRKPRAAGDRRDRAILVHVSENNATAARDSMAELRELAGSAGIDTVHEITQRRPPDRKYVLGKGRLKQALIKAMQTGAEALVFDLNLSPSQLNSLADLTDLKVIDRTQVILDIFAQHAVTREGKLQVELAQLRYLLPRLSAKHTAFSRLTGGIGGRGPGETKLEINRRRARDRIAQLEREVEKLGQRRELRRGARTRKGVPIVSIVGYTNAGKSTLLNHLTGSDVLAEDALFATLNPVSRRLRFPREREVVVTDTVGFIRNLPRDLMAAFRTTFEELHEANLILHVLDGSCPDAEEKFDTVRTLLHDLELDAKPTLVVVNKTDRIAPGEAAGLVTQFGGLPVCALDRTSFTPLLEALERHLWHEETAACAR